MAYKTGGKKTKYIYEYGYIKEEYIIYCAEESVTEICTYKMYDENGKEKNISIVCEDAIDDYGNHSLIDCLYCLKNNKDMLYQNSSHNIVIEDMTTEEINKIYYDINWTPNEMI